MPRHHVFCDCCNYPDDIAVNRRGVKLCNLCRYEEDIIERTIDTPNGRRRFRFITPKCACKACGGPTIFGDRTVQVDLGPE